MTDDSTGSTAGAVLCRELAEYANVRFGELTAMYEPVVRATTAYSALVAEIVSILGENPPRSPQDVVVRDLLADVFDFLLEWQRPLMEGRPNVAFPLGRRAYESLSLLSACLQSEDIARKWSSGKQIGNDDIRKALAKLPLSEAENGLRVLYKFFSEGSHPNRSLVAARYLGDGNEFVLGSIARPNMVLVTVHCIHLMQMWFWYGAVVLYFSKELVVARRPGLGTEYLATANEARETIKWLAEQIPRLREEYLAECSASE